MQTMDFFKYTDHHDNISDSYMEDGIQNRMTLYFVAIVAGE
jgi:hypothetical protein